MNIILENNKNNMDIILVQEPPKSLIRRVLSHTDPTGDPIYGTPNHPDWTLFIRQNPNQESYARVATYVNKKLQKMRFTLRLDIINHRDVNVLAFHSGQLINYVINVYSDDNQSALHFLNRNIIDLNNTVVMTGDFNIRDNDWDPNYPHHSAHTEDLLTLAESLGLNLSPPVNPGPTRFADNPRDTNSVIDLAFINPSNSGFGQHSLHPELRRPSDHVPLIIEVGINETNIDNSFWSISKDSDEEKDFIKAITDGTLALDTSNITSKENLEEVAQRLAGIFNEAWHSQAKKKRITKHSKEWWNHECTESLNKYRNTGDIEHWREFKSSTRSAKKEFFNNKIYEIASSNKRPWDLMNWVKKKNLPTIESILYEGQLCNTLPDLWHALHSSYNSAENRPINASFLNEIQQADQIHWPPFSKQEFKDAIAKCSSSSTPGPDHIAWRHLKSLITNERCLQKIVHIANACIELEFWPSHFKSSNTVVIPKPNKINYDSPKSFRPIVLLNTTGKLIEKVISNRLQFQLSTNGFIDSH